jgi:hypothetical protein
MDRSFIELKTITDKIYRGEQIKWSLLILTLLDKYQITPRRDDGKLHSVQISIPKTAKNAIVVGLRYYKQDDTNSEDHFLFQDGQPIIKCYGNRLEKIFPEYKGTHKAQISQLVNQSCAGHDKLTI